MELLKDLISTRGAQLASRYGAMAVLWAAGKMSVTIDPNDANSTAKVAATFAVAGVLAIIDHYSHAQQAADNTK